MREGPLLVCREDAEFRLRRISDDELHRLGRFATAIDPDLLFWMVWNGRSGTRLSLPQFVAGMSLLFGDSGYHFDPYKQSFCFPFHLTTQKGAVRGDYLWLVEDWKGGLECRLLRREKGPTKRLTSYVPCVDAELSRDDVHYLTNWIAGYVEGYLQTTGPEDADAPRLDVPDFVRTNQAGLQLYGHRDGRPFEREFEDEREFAHARAAMPSECLDAPIAETL